ncbi:helix-turn-helix domain-containing protein [Thermopolyspora sp. NPDC052614]|uniref:helix-turn-helix domain-containing protein n=1 Tax=Thermopolyspora sp. NPDC052614 TaxID=3155682 RepID=UPI00342234E1
MSAAYAVGGHSPLMTPEEVAELCGVDIDTARRWGRTGKLTQRKTPGGGRTLFLRSEVYALMGIPQAPANVSTT